ncbi:hypothetical protein PIB19_10840 [Sphingomonas sp. 7/4-4]|uniref:hypothetical protein n=1 Tax=Sphingomonas sp. 7/4-4 TaxID=3018446 RepID=UPI0022F39703|nr:hypothetical protein [Sphingomonas sp. 7/4-4]WBY09727.1 hypothetical protein PIB19_10840 [Sphingomonas sp. 7/4-4]
MAASHLRIRHPAGRCSRDDFENPNRNQNELFTNIEDTQITRGGRKAFDAFIPAHRRLFPIEPCPREVARAAVREVLG